LFCRPIMNVVLLKLPNSYIVSLSNIDIETS